MDTRHLLESFVNVIAPGSSFGEVGGHGKLSSINVDYRRWLWKETTIFGEISHSHSGRHDDKF
jgi:hypothetical protein